MDWKSLFHINLRLGRYVSFCFTLWSSSIQFYLSLINYKKLRLRPVFCCFFLFLGLGLTQPYELGWTQPVSTRKHAWIVHARLLQPQGNCKCKCTLLVNYLAQLEKLTWKLDEGDGVLGTPLFLLSFSFPLVLSFLLLSLDATFVYVCLFVLVLVCVSLCLSLLCSSSSFVPPLVSPLYFYFLFGLSWFILLKKRNENLEIEKKVISHCAG